MEHCIAGDIAGNVIADTPRGLAVGRAEHVRAARNNVSATDAGIFLFAVAESLFEWNRIDIVDQGTGGLWNLGRTGVLLDPDQNWDQWPPLFLAGSVKNVVRRNRITGSMSYAYRLACGSTENEIRIGRGSVPTSYVAPVEGLCGNGVNDANPGGYAVALSDVRHGCPAASQNTIVKFGPVSVLDCSGSG